MNIEFENNKGDRLEMDESTTIKELIALGFRNIRLVNPKEPLEDGWWRSLNPPSPENS